MPAGSRVDKIYQHLLSQGKDKGTAARIAQAASGQALATGKPPVSGPNFRRGRGRVRRSANEERAEPQDNLKEEKGE